jgi:NAD(P)-dependent dehydrogenase (short-subunit alcohol dehydrogenase family)
MNLEQQRALVTGATSGIGRAVALKLAEAGDINGAVLPADGGRTAV